MSPPSLLVTDKFNNDLPSSQNYWDHFPSPSPQYMEGITQPMNPLPSSPIRFVTTEINFISDLTIKLPLTPSSTKKSLDPIHNFGKLNISIMVPRSPESPGNNLTNFLNTLESTVFKEILSAESSLRLPLPQLPTVSSKPYPFPVSMFGIYVAGEGLHCDELTRSIIDS